MRTLSYKFKDEDFSDLISYLTQKDTEGLLKIMGTEILNKISLGTLISVRDWIEDNYRNKHITSEKNYNNREKILNILDQIIEPKWKNAHLHQDRWNLAKYYPSLKS